MAQREWDRRIRRANELTSSYPFAAEGLRYYSRVATFQRSLYSDIQKALADSPAAEATGSLRDELDLFLLLPNFSRFLALIEQIAPAPLAQAAAGLARKGTAGWQRAIEEFWHGDLDTALAVGGLDEEWEGADGCDSAARTFISVDFSAAVRRVSCGSAQEHGCGWSAFDLSFVRRKADRGCAVK